MKKYFKIFIALLPIFAMNILAQQSIIIDHNCTDINKIPISFILTAKQNLKIGYGHTSHGSQLVTGMDAIKAANTTFDYERSYWELSPGIFFNDYWGNAGGADDLPRE